ncbi:retrovirus-related pol polyprotein from transposon TNT 1-94 [Tanacetum coccineum]|uniref:Retrovirus-related pol polyprotein from transposon TNT 1-94 n=1 Tax=Tanacetum coccineum TaxID=301880 RepID=A0ABQ5DST6_9ASTR
MDEGQSLFSCKENSDECDAFGSDVMRVPLQQDLVHGKGAHIEIQSYDSSRASYDRTNTPRVMVQDHDTFVIHKDEYHESTRRCKRCTTLTIEDLKAQLEGNLKVTARSSVKTKVLAPGMYVIDVEPIPPRLKNNRNAHLTYINHLKESVETVRDIVEEARVFKPLDTVLNYACQYTKLSQELVEYVIGTCPKEFTERYSKAPSIPLTRKKQVTFTDTCSTSTNNTQKHGVHQKVQQSNVHVIHSTGVNTSTEASGSKPRSNTKKNRILPAKKENKKKVEVHLRTNKSVWTKVNRVDSSISSKRVVINSNSESVCKMCDKCLNSANHEMCVVNILSSVNATPTVKIVLNKGKQIWKPKGKLSDNSLNKTKRVWKATGKLFADIGYQWRPTGKKFTLGKLDCGYQWRPTGKKFALGEMCPLTKLSVKCCSKHMTGNRSKLKNFVEKFIGTVRFGNDHFGAIMGYGDYVIGDSVISRVYYVEGLRHNLFSVGQFCDSDLEVAFRKHTCFVRDINGADILKGSRSTNLYTISIDDMMKSSPICLLSKASKSKSWLWHRRLNHLNFGTINDLARKDLVRGLPRLKFEKDHLCSACQLGKSKKFSHKPKSENTNMEVLHTLHMDLCGPMRVQSIKGKKYILVIVDDYSRFTWVGLNKTVRDIRTDNGTEFVNQVMSKFYEGVGVFHQKVVPRTPQQNGVVERRNHTLVDYYEGVGIFRSKSVPENTQQILRVVESSVISRVAQVAPPGTSLSTTMAQDAPSTSASSSTFVYMHHYRPRHQGLWKNPTLRKRNPTKLINHKIISEDGPKIILWITSLAIPLHLNELKLSDVNDGTKKYGMDLSDLALLSMVDRLKLDEVSWDSIDSKLDLENGLGSPNCTLPSSRPDLVFAVCMCARYQAKPTKKHFEAIKRDLSGIWIRIPLSWVFGTKDNCMSLTAYADADHAGCQDSRRSTSGSAQFLGDRLVSWSSKKQRSTTISTIEAEYIAMSGCLFVFFVNTLLQNTMAEQNVPTQPPTRTDEQIISVDILSNTNFFRAFTASASVPAIYLQQFCNTMKYDEKTGVYRCQIDEQWFDLSADLLRKALAITPVIPAQPFELLVWKDFWQAVLGKEFTQRNQDILSHSKHVTKASLKDPKKKVTPLLIPYGRFSKFIPKGETVEVFRMAIPDPLIIEAIQQSSYYPKYLEMVAENTKKTPQENQQSKPAPAPTKKPSKHKLPHKVRKGKPTFQLVDEDDEAQHFVPRHLNLGVGNRPWDRLYLMKGGSESDRESDGLERMKSIYACLKKSHGMFPWCGGDLCHKRKRGELVEGIQTFFSHKASHKASLKNPKKKVTPLLIPYGRFSKVIIYYLASNNNIHRRPDSAVHHTGDDYILGNLKFVPKGESVEVFGMAIPDPLITEAIQQSSYYPKYLEMVAENTKKTPQESASMQPATKRATPKKPTTTTPVKQSKPAPPPTKKPSKRKLPQKVRKGKPSFQLVDEDDEAQQESIPQEEGNDPDLERAKKMSLEAHQEKGEGEGDDADMERAIKLSLDPAFLPQGRAPVRGVTIRDPVSETTSKLHEVVGKGKAVVTEEQVAHSLIDLSKKKRTTDQFILVRRDQTPPDSTTGPSSQPEDDTSEKVIHESSSTSDSERTESETETAAPKGDKDQGEVDSSTVTSGVSIPVSDPEKAHEALAGPDPEPMKEDQTGSDSGKLHVSLAGPNPEHMDDEFLATAYPKVHENLKLITDERVIDDKPESHSGSMSSMKNLDDTFNFGDQFLYDKPTEDDQEKSKVREESDSTIPDPSHQTVTSTPPVIAPFTDVSSSKPSLLVTPPPINTEATTITTSLPEITPFITLQLRVARLEQEMSEVKKTDHSADVLERHTADLIEKYSVLPGLESIQNQESEKSPKEIIRIKKEQGEEKQDSTYSIRSTDKVDLEEFDLKSALFKHMNKIKSANRNTANYHLYHALMEALIADEDAMDKEVADKVKDHKRKHDSDDDEDDDDDEGPSAGSNQGKSAKRRRYDSGASGSAQPPTKDDEQSSKKPRKSDASASKQHPDH